MAADQTLSQRATAQADGGTDAPVVLWLDDPRARDRDLTGGKAAALADAASAGCPVVGGFVLTVAATATIDDQGWRAVVDSVSEAWERLGAGEDGAIARSSSVVEDASDESMAGRYESVADITSPTALREAVGTVMDSRRDVARDHDTLDPHHPIAVLVQRQVDPDWGGVAFGVDPVTGRPDRRMVTVSTGAPEALVSGEVEGDTWVTDADGDPVDRPEDPTTSIDADAIRQVVAMVNRLSDLLDAPQDVEWGAAADGTVWLLQSRPVTTEVTGVPTGPELGTGPIAETFPDAMPALEEDLWVPPLREALAHALTTAAVASRGDVDESPVLVTVDGRPAVDMELMGRSARNRRPVRDRLRRIRASWRIGRLRAALPTLGRRLAERADEDLRRIAPLDTYTDDQLLDLLGRARRVLRSLHGHEVLTGLITDPSEQALSGTGVALRLLTAARREGLDEATAIAREPAILALTPPRIGGGAELPSVTEVPRRPDPTNDPTHPAVVREALRMRVRWVHELTARVALALGGRLRERGLLSTPTDVRHLRLTDLAEALSQGTRPSLQAPPSTDPLPARFRLGVHGEVVPSRQEDDGDGTGAGGGRAEGVPHVLHDDDPLEDVPEGAVLVVGELRPDLAPTLGRIAALVAETGSPLSHMAILSRESGVATVVNLADARERMDGAGRVSVDGGAGTVEITEQGARR